MLGRRHCYHLEGDEKVSSDALSFQIKLFRVPKNLLFWNSLQPAKVPAPADHVVGSDISRSAQLCKWQWQ